MRAIDQPMEGQGPGRGGGLGGGECKRLSDEEMEIGGDARMFRREHRGVTG